MRTAVELSVAGANDDPPPSAREKSDNSNQGHEILRRLHAYPLTRSAAHYGTAILQATSYPRRPVQAAISTSVSGRTSSQTERPTSNRSSRPFQSTKMYGVPPLPPRPLNRICARTRCVGLAQPFT